MSELAIRDRWHTQCEWEQNWGHNSLISGQNHRARALSKCFSALSNIEELKIRHIVTSNPTIERPSDLGRFLLRLDDCNDGSVATAMRLLVMLPVRPGELVQMHWEDVDLVGADWRYVVSKTKHLDKSKHIVPLPEQALVLLRDLHKTRAVDEEGKGWVFVSPVYPGRPINPTSMLKSFQRIWPEYDITAHGFRATYRTIAHEHLGIDPIVLELSLSHRMPGALGAVYARAQLLTQRRETAQQWANYLVCRLTNKVPHTCETIASRARCTLFKMSSPLAFQT